mmetsp:Transcript_9971/g.29573  ORF Transcript_9971/g.29573 Transcript_9971/m.29573 type:complete len:237 (+) Transcript_9971:431-1141(+)
MGRAAGGPGAVPRARGRRDARGLLDGRLRQFVQRLRALHRRGIRQRRHQVVRPEDDDPEVGHERAKWHLPPAVRPEGHPDEQARGLDARIQHGRLRFEDIPPHRGLRGQKGKGDQEHPVGLPFPPPEPRGVRFLRRQRFDHVVQILVPPGAGRQGQGGHRPRQRWHVRDVEPEGALHAARDLLRLAHEQDRALRLRVLGPDVPGGHLYQVALILSGFGASLVAALSAAIARPLACT